MSNKYLNKGLQGAGLQDRASQLSDLLDDCGQSAELDKLLADSEQMESWYRYNLVRSVLKNENSAYSSFQFTQAVSAKIAGEPAILSRPASSKSNNPPILRRFAGGFAIAASVAFAMVFSVQMMPSGSMQAGVETATTTLNPSVESLIKQTPQDLAEQHKLDEIQLILDRMSQQRQDVNQQLVGGPVMVKSFIVKTKPEAIPLEARIRAMKKPSEMGQKDN